MASRAVSKAGASLRARASGDAAPSGIARKARVAPAPADAPASSGAPVSASFYRGKGRPNAGVARPIVKWAGGKARLVERLLALMPPGTFDTYAEPFCGGAAMFFALGNETRRRFRRAILSDKNEELIALYRAIQSDVGRLVDRLAAYRDEHLPLDLEGRRAHYYEVREASTRGLSDVERGARLIFLNKTCFNGLWRVNASGQFNVPFGRYLRPRILDAEALSMAHRALQGVELRLSDFAEVASELSRGDFVYFDPPYVPLSKTANFTAYAASRFDEHEQERLADTLEALRVRGVRAMLSNTCSDVTRELYGRNKRLVMTTISVPRSINSDPTKRGDVDELVVLNYTSPMLRRKSRTS